MARVTVEDCLHSVENRFKLVLVGAKRARQLANGKEAYVEWENDKPTVVALREIADGHVTEEILASSGRGVELAEEGFVEPEEAVAEEAAAPEADASAAEAPDAEAQSGEEKPEA